MVVLGALRDQVQRLERVLIAGERVERIRAFREHTYLVRWKRYGREGRMEKEKEEKEGKRGEDGEENGKDVEGKDEEEERTYILISEDGDEVVRSRGSGKGGDRRLITWITPRGRRANGIEGLN